MRKIFVTLGFCALLAGCDDNGSGSNPGNTGSSSPTPTPNPTPTSTPTPTPTPAFAYDRADDFSRDRVLISFLGYDDQVATYPDASMPDGRFYEYDAPTHWQTAATLTFNAADSSLGYVYHDALQQFERTLSFNRNEIDTSFLSGLRYARQGAQGTVIFSAPYPTTYVNLAEFNVEKPSQVVNGHMAQITASTYILFGAPTEPADIPTGEATFNGRLTLHGYQYDDRFVGIPLNAIVPGTFVISSSNELRGTMNIPATDKTSGFTHDIKGTFDPKTNSVSFVIIDSSQPGSGIVGDGKGRLYGPAGKELGVIFRVRVFGRLFSGEALATR